MFHALANGKIDTGRYEFRAQRAGRYRTSQSPACAELKLPAVLHSLLHLTETYLLWPWRRDPGRSLMALWWSPAAIFADELRELRSRARKLPTTAYLALALVWASSSPCRRARSIGSSTPRWPARWHGEPVQADSSFTKEQVDLPARGLRLAVDLGQWC